MADEEKDTPTTQPNTPNPAAAQKADSAASANVAAVDDDTPEEVVAAHQAYIKAEQAAAAQQMKSQESMAKAQENLDKARARAAGASVDDSDFPGFFHKTWAGHDCLQCAFCSWDVVTSSMYDLNARMNEHLAAAHPNWRMLKILFDEAGNFIGDEVE